MIKHTHHSDCPGSFYIQQNQNERSLVHHAVLGRQNIAINKVCFWNSCRYVGQEVQRDWPTEAQVCNVEI